MRRESRKVKNTPKSIASAQEVVSGLSREEAWIDTAENNNKVRLQNIGKEVRHR
jgi:hypothetical protein